MDQQKPIPEVPILPCVDGQHRWSSTRPNKRASNEGLKALLFGLVLDGLKALFVQQRISGT